MTVSTKRPGFGIRLGTVRLQMWKLATVPRNAAVILMTTAVMAQAKVWKFREA
jgi:hypothetical protein